MFIRDWFSCIRELLCPSWCAPQQSSYALTWGAPGWYKDTVHILKRITAFYSYMGEAKARGLQCWSLTSCVYAHVCVCTCACMCLSTHVFEHQNLISGVFSSCFYFSVWDKTFCPTLGVDAHQTPAFRLFPFSSRIMTIHCCAQL